MAIYALTYEDDGYVIVSALFSSRPALEDLLARYQANVTYRDDYDIQEFELDQLLPPPGMLCFHIAFRYDTNYNQVYMLDARPELDPPTPIIMYFSQPGTEQYMGSLYAASAEQAKDIAMRDFSLAHPDFKIIPWA